MNAQGHVEPYKRDGVVVPDRWRIVIDRGRDESGKRLRDYYPFTGSEKAANKDLRRLLSSADVDRYAAPERMTCAEWFETWARDYAPINIHAATLDGYTGVVNRYLVPSSGRSGSRSSVRRLSKRCIAAWRRPSPKAAAGCHGRRSVRRMSFYTGRSSRRGRTGAFPTTPRRRVAV